MREDPAPTGGGGGGPVSAFTLACCVRFEGHETDQGEKEIVPNQRRKASGLKAASTFPAADAPGATAISGKKAATCRSEVAHGMRG